MKETGSSISMGREMSRREALRLAPLLTLTTLSIGTPSIGSWPLGAQDARSDLVELLRGEALGPTRRAGAAYLELRPEEAEASRLETEVLSGYSGQSELAGFLSDKISNDFDQGRTAVVGNWMLAETEARLFALAHLAATA